jgi:hypothetical protein
VTRSRPVIAVGFGVLAGLIVSIVILAFLWPVATSQARELPVGVVGGPLPQSGDLPFEITSYGSRAEAVRAIKERKIYGAFVLDATGPEALVAGAGSAPAVQIIKGVGTQLAGAQNKTLVTTDVVSLSADDPTGAGLNAMGFPLVLGGIVGGVLVSLLVAGVTRRLLALGIYAVVGGAATALVTEPLLGAVPGGFGPNAVALAIGMLGTASTVVGLNALLGVAGIGVGAVITMFIANPISGTTLPYQFIAGPWGEVGQNFVPGAANSLVREVNYFPDASMVHEWTVLLAWVLVGVLLSLTGHFRSTTPVHLPQSELEPMPV